MEEKMIPEKMSLKGRFFPRIQHIIKIILAAVRKVDKTVLEGYVVFLCVNDEL